VAAWPLWLKLPVVLIVSDTGAYWAHRASHKIPLLWRFHSIHHSAEQLDWLVNTRGHPFDLVFTKLSGLVPVYLLGLAQTTGPRLDPVVAWVMIIGITWTFFIHSNIRLRLGPLEWLVSSPAFHHWHHTNDEHRDHNFAAIFPWIDRVFGTSWLPKYWPPVYGIDAKIPPTLTGQLLDPLTRGVRLGSDRSDAVPVLGSVQK
jgi:sterol desaturase/sphingolipid hydroxylase (fatty acid hydroxylase superfamily)